jgi:hypothetical protein
VASRGACNDESGHGGLQRVKRRLVQFGRNACVVMARFLYDAFLWDLLQSGNTCPQRTFGYALLSIAEFFINTLTGLSQ